ncbi:hypothetical protein SCATT_15500 [Streptantibioticus cattleyicolor NRRL 8057 = DSM 46488]|uniref:Uncharacterized protein n=1 Tax=Streptantibioticus cattleyicolor (strain ATCC 35852 / DSM 46488 / JCM 4925 / NBRC 14057 / NRRL 8057) TaxID=1003195 RepID=G8X235_STREN|nr:hypothetical protein SCATT_15500 [Streptantibioticus cattleyicolor NRRL 8057 = DSM 46488]
MDSAPAVTGRGPLGGEPPTYADGDAVQHVAVGTVWRSHDLRGNGSRGLGHR